MPSPYWMVLLRFSGKGARFCVWQVGQIVVCWVYFVRVLFIWRSILYRISVGVLCVFVRSVWQLVQVFGLRVRCLSGGRVIFSPWPLCPGCAPGFLSVFWCLIWGLFQRSLEGGIELFLLFIPIFASSAATLSANT